MTRLLVRAGVVATLAGASISFEGPAPLAAHDAVRHGDSASAAQGAPAASTVSAADDAALRDVVRRYVNAREARDPASIGAMFTADADQLVSSGEWRRGREALVTGTLASSAATGGTRSIDVQTIRMLGPDVALVDGRYEISGLAGGAVRRMWSSFVMVRQEGAWRIGAIRNMLPATPAGAPPATPPPVRHD